MDSSPLVTAHAPSPSPMAKDEGGKLFRSSLLRLACAYPAHEQNLAKSYGEKHFTRFRAWGEGPCKSLY
jgi:hypothetical protein